MADTNIENMFDTLAISEGRERRGPDLCESDETQSQTTSFANDTPPDSSEKWSCSSFTLLDEDIGADFRLANDYFGSLGQLAEQDLTFDFGQRNHTVDNERVVDNIFRKIRRWDISRRPQSHKPGPSEEYQTQSHAGPTYDHLPLNAESIEKTEMFKIIAKMPKGAHLHIHFNTYLSPKALLGIAKGVDLMFITSSLPLIGENDFENFDKCDIAFSILTSEKEKLGSLFETGSRFGHTMKLSTFVEQFPHHYRKVGENIHNVDDWLLGKLLSYKNEIDRPFQSTASTRNRLNECTRTIQGFLNYETVFKYYTRLCLEDFLRHNIQYVEIRSHFTASNTLYTEDGMSRMNSSDAAKIIIEEVTQFQEEMAKRGEYFGGLKIIYCASRSANLSDVEVALAECLEFKKRWPDWIAGFDLVGEGATCRPLKDFASQLLRFQEDCRIADVEIPFLFHCGGTLEDIAETDGNLVEALLLGSKRVGHGLELTESPFIMEYMKKNGVCVELCPMPNQNSETAPKVSEHLIYQLLENNVHFTINSSEGALLSSSHSHGFYRFMVGKSDIDLYRLKQVIIWSMEHACFSKPERLYVREKWKVLWDEFLLWVIENYDGSKFEGHESII